MVHVLSNISVFEKDVFNEPSMLSNTPNAQIFCILEYNRSNNPNSEIFNILDSYTLKYITWKIY